MAKQSEDQSVKHASLAHAVIAVMSEVKGMEKNSRVGGSSAAAYDGTKDMDVKDVFNEKLAKHGLCILPTDIEETTQIDRWEEIDPWSKETPKAMKQKQSVFTKVNCKYILMHADSGQEKVVAGYGHGVDPQDKGAGKATTYALKNALLYAFLTPVGKIDDADKHHSEEIATPQTKAPVTQAPEKKAEVKAPDPAKLEAAILKVVAGIGKSADLKTLGEAWGKLKPAIKNDKRVIAAKEAKKAELTPKAG